MKVVLVVALLLILVLTCPEWACSGWYSYTIADGLTHDRAEVIFVDGEGNLWFGGSGVARYDGVTWQQYYRTSDGVYLSVTGIAQDHSGNLWFTTYGDGAACYDGVTWRTYTTADGLASDRIEAIAVDLSGNIWFGFGFDEGGVTRFDGTSWHTFTIADGLPSNSVTAIAVDRIGHVWVAASDRVCRYDGVSWHTYDTYVGASTITEDHNGHLWFGGYAGLYRYDGASWTGYTTADGLPSNQITAIAEDSHGNMWVGTPSGGVGRYDGVSWRTYTTSDGLADNSVREITMDRSGNLWFGTSHGVSRYDGVSWRVHTVDDGLADNRVYAALEDRFGNLWFGTYGGGVSRYDGASWQTYTSTDGLAGNIVRTIVEDHFGNLWFGTHEGVTKYDGVNWHTFTTADGLTDNHVISIAEDRFGNLWFGTYGGGVSRYDGVNWSTYTPIPWRTDAAVSAILEDHSGDLWFGTYEGLSWFDGVDWRTYTAADGLAGKSVYSIAEDCSGNIWVGMYEGLSRYDRVEWHTYTQADGLLDNEVHAISEDRFGNLWFGNRSGASRYDGINFGTYSSLAGITSYVVQDILVDSSDKLWFATQHGVIEHEPDRLAPETVISPAVPRLSASKTQTIGFTSGYGDLTRITFSHSFDGSPWSLWSYTDFWLGENLQDGKHVFRVRARDEIGNVDSTEAICVFEIDAAPPIPIITFPRSGEPLQDSVALRGTASDLRFSMFRVETSAHRTGDWELLFESTSPVTDERLCWWNTSSLPDGSYDLRLSVTDTLGLTGTALVSVIVDNHAPWSYETAPAIVSDVLGGSVYTTNGEVRLYFPPGAFAQDTEVGIEESDEGEVPDTLGNGAYLLSTGFEISWMRASLLKSATLDMSYAESGPFDGTLALYVFGADSTWKRLGGTDDASIERISSPITEAGRYAVFIETAEVLGVNTLTALSVTPRVFSPSGNFANQEAAIGFTLGRRGAVTVKVYNRAGRFVREVISGELLEAGANLVRWDGRDTNGQTVVDGLYLVSVEALGQKQVKTIAVVR